MVCFGNVIEATNCATAMQTEQEKLKELLVEAIIGDLDDFVWRFGI